MKKELPVLTIGHFQASDGPHDFYAERLRRHVKDHLITRRPHKHDFFLVVLFTSGSGTHEVDFTTYKIAPGTLFLLSPGQSHQWALSADADGIIFFHTREFFDRGFNDLRLHDYPFFNSAYNAPVLSLRPLQRPAVAQLFTVILEEYQQQKAMKRQKLLGLISILYIELARLYKPMLPIKSEQYMDKLRQFEDLLDANFKTLKLPSQYAERMHITERHLNRICKTCLNKTPSAMILDRGMLEAKRLLMQDQVVISDVAARLGYPDAAYFSRLFKKQSGKTPREFMQGYR